MNARLMRIECDLKVIKVTTKEILDFVTSIDSHFKQHRDLPERMDRAEADINDLKARTR